MPLSTEELRAEVQALASRPRHEKVRGGVQTLLVYGLGLDARDVNFEQPVPEVRGRLDALLGRTVFEFKSDLRAEIRDVERRMPDYLADRERASGQQYIGIATDGADFMPYELRDGKLVPLPPYRTDPENPRGLLAWLDGVLLLSISILPEAEAVRRDLGRGSLTFAIARSTLKELWDEVKENADVRLKRELWAALLSMVYGSRVESDDLFFQHTYLTIVAKTMATQVLGRGLPEPEALLSGRSFDDARISGAVESDFFDWVLAAAGSRDLINRLAQQVLRFDLRHLHQDVLKVLYESLIDPEQRHYLGEYYTPDWLADRICRRAIDDPLDQRVLDPSCGSGTFLFHAVRRYLEAAGKQGMTNRQALAGCCNHVFGIDVHPVAVIIARVTYLLALGEERLRNHPALSLPVYLGDSLQWNTQTFLADRSVLIEVPEGPVLHFPFCVTRDPTVFDVVLEQMQRLSAERADAAALLAWLQRAGIGEPEDRRVLIKTYEDIRDLTAGGRDQIWGYVARNLTRPIWLSTAEQKADVVVGNPPWLSYRYMSAAMQRRFAVDSWQRGLWAGGKVATHQDLSGLFYALSAELYLKPGGLIAFVMPYAAMSRRQFKGFRTGWFGVRAGQIPEVLRAARERGEAPPPPTRRSRRGATNGAGGIGEVFATVRFEAGWALDERVQPLFPVPACVLFARRDEIGPLPATIEAAVPSGRIEPRDATLEQVAGVVQWVERPWPAESDETQGSLYRAAFHQGATMVPRTLCVVERSELGRFGGDPATPVVQSRVAGQEKAPWKDIRVSGLIEAEFLRALYLGESIAPFRLLDPVLAVVPWDSAENALLDAVDALRAGYTHLARWLREAEGHWAAHRHGSMTFQEQLDYYGKLSAQFPDATLRVVYSKSGTLPAAAIMSDKNALVDHTLYWARPASPSEARYLVAVLNSEVVRDRGAHLQARGQWGARHFDKVMFELPIPEFSATAPLHTALAAAAERAEVVAAAVPLREKEYFTRTRGRIRDALREDGVAHEIDRLVEELLAQ